MNGAGVPQFLCTTCPHLITRAGIAGSSLCYLCPFLELELSQSHRSFSSRLQFVSAVDGGMGVQVTTLKLTCVIYSLRTYQSVW